MSCFRSFRDSRILLSPSHPGKHFRRFFSALLFLKMGLLLLFSASLALPSPAGAIENLGGIVVDIEPSHSPGDLRLLIDQVPLGPGGVPLCQKPSGKLLSILSQNLVRRAGEHSTFVVSPEPVDPLSALLAVGDCLTVEGRRDRRGTDPDADDIRIVSSLQGQKQNSGSVQAFFLKIWTEHPSRSSIFPFQGGDTHLSLKQTFFPRSGGS